MIKDYIHRINKKGKSFSNEWEKSSFFKENKTFFYIRNNKTKQVKKILKSKLSSFLDKGHPFSLRRHLPDEYIVQKVNKQGQSYKNKYEKYKFISLKRKPRKIIICVQNLYGKEKKITQYKSLINDKTNPFNSNYFTSTRLIKERVNKVGLNQKKWFKFVFIKRKKNRVFVKNTKTKEIKQTDVRSIINNKCNPFSKMNGHSILFIKEEINKFGKTFKNKYETFFVKKIFGNGRKRLITLKNPYTKREKTVDCSSLMCHRFNPLLIKKELPEKFIINETNKRGKSFLKKEERSKYVSHFRKGKNNELWINIQNIETKEIVSTKYQSFVRYGNNPFNLSQDREEVTKVHPKIKTILINKNLEFVKEHHISKRSKIDFLVKISDKVFIIEAKSDKKQWTQENITSQIQKYNEDAKEKYGENFLKTILVSPKGRYGISLAELEKELNLLINQHQNSTTLVEEHPSQN